MAKQYIHEIGDKLSVGSTADNLPKHIKEIAPVMYNDGNNNFNSIQTALNGKAASTHSHGNIASGGTLTDTAAAAAGNDYVVIRDADNSKVQTSTIKGTEVADAVSKKHSHSTLTLSTTAQAYDGSHTLALPSTDPYTSARTPSSHASSTTTYGVGTTANYGHVKLATGDMNGATHDDGTISIWEEPPKDTSKEKKVYQMFGYDKHDGYSVRRFGIFESKELAEKYLMTASMAALGVPKYKNMVIEEAVVNHITDNSAKRWFYKYIDERLDTNPPQYVGKYIEDHQSNSFFFELVYKFRTF